MALSKKAKAVTDVESAAISTVGLDKLHLDPKNPRLPTSVNRTEPEILQYIASETAIEDLVSAIATNGFFPGEPLVVIPDPKRTDHYLVAEGNRRLTALRLLQNPRILKEPSARLLKIVETAKHAPTDIPVVIRDTREEVLPYLGFRHITGVKAWEPLAKARYMRQLFDALTRKSDTPEERYRQVAQAIGSRSTNVRRNLDALAVYEVMEGAEFFKIPELSEDTIKFGSLYTALGDEKISAFVGASKPTSNNDDPDYAPTHPIVNAGTLKKKEISDLAKWMFAKNTDGETVLGESRNLRHLAMVVSTPAAVKVLRDGAKLDYAYRLTTGVSTDFARLLYDAESVLREAASVVANVSYDESLSALVVQLTETLEVIGATLARKKSSRK